VSYSARPRQTAVCLTTKHAKRRTVDTEVAVEVRNCNIQRARSDSCGHDLYNDGKPKPSDHRRWVGACSDRSRRNRFQGGLLTRCFIQAIVLLWRPVSRFLLKKRGLSPIILLPCSSLWTFGAAIMLVNQGRRIEFWNSSLPRLLGFKTKPPAELQLEPLPLPGKLRSLIVRCHRSVLPKQ